MTEMDMMVVRLSVRLAQYEQNIAQLQSEVQRLQQELAETKVPAKRRAAK